MRIGVYAGSEKAVGGTYTIREDLLRGLLETVSETPHRIILFVEQDSGWRDRADLPTSVEMAVVRRPAIRAGWSLIKRAVNRLFTEVLQAPALFSKESWIDSRLEEHNVQFFVNLGPDALSMQVPYLCAVFDLQHRYQPYMPEVCLQGYWERWEAKYKRVLGRATFVVTGTTVGRDEVMRYYQVNPERILTLPHPTPRFALEAAQQTDRGEQHGDTTPYVLYPAQFWPHKNHVTLLESLAIINGEYGHKIKAVFVGSDQGNLDFVRRRAAELGVKAYVDFRGVVSRDELVRLYRNAVALAYVSTCGPENLPPLEAFALGCPVVAGSVPGAAEQLADAALLVTPTDAKAIADSIVRVWRDAALRDDLIARGRKRAAQFTSADFARGIFRALEDFESRRKCWDSEEPYRRPHLWTRALNG